MTLNDLIIRLRKIEKDPITHPYTQVKLGKQYNCKDDCFEDFDIIQRDKEIIFVPSDAFIKNKKEV